MPRRRITWDSFDIYFTPSNGQFIEERCIEGLIARFATRFGENQVQVHEWPRHLEHRYASIQPETVVVEHTLTGRWCVWSTADHLTWTLLRTGTVRLPDWTYYPGGFFERRVTDLIGAIVPNWHPSWSAELRRLGLDSQFDRIGLDGWLASEPFLPGPYPGQNIDVAAVERVFSEAIPPQPLLIFRGFYWPGRQPFIHHLRTIVAERGLTQVVLVSIKEHSTIPVEAHAPVNPQSLPECTADSPFGELAPALYLREMAHATACLSLPGANDICRRDIEALALGIPVIRPAYTADWWGRKECEAIIETDPCNEYDCGEDFNWRATSDGAVRRSCEAMVDAGLALIEDPARLRRLKRSARAWYERFCSPDRVADYVFACMIGKFSEDLTRRWTRYDGSLR